MNKFSYRFSPFVDPIGRVSDKPFLQEEGITDNPHLFDGEAVLLLALLGRLEKSDIEFVDQTLIDVEVAPGLFRRHSKTFQEKYSIPFHSVSHDEYNGICMMAAASPEFFRTYAHDIVFYGERYNWQYCDLYPNSDFFQYFFDNPIKAIREVKSYLADIKANPQDTNSVDLRHSPNIVALTQIRQPRDAAFYKIAAGMIPSLFQTLNLAFAIVFTSTGDPKEGRGGTKLMAWFRMLAIRRLNGESLLLKLAHKLFERVLTKKLGIDYPYKLISMYFDRDDNGLRHPMIMLVKEYLELQKLK
jgi:hypothetical protein